ncbi:hypothetical protein AQJ46_35530 [Streptomyces canus]|uniref:Uncharacterized protein n=1 Tax=Streptomyces canus TaxID=58343 RepID=A0A117QYZ4_9ACTN|nr:MULTISPECIES: hypothetical protein [Streptomyces]KUN61726.1 hypothetical protein AQJ46_35530 [Streptomyces canus]MDI5906768.1 hypothetical protein [Streptomyces sp. 12257]
MGPIVADEIAVVGLVPAEEARLSELDRQHRLVQAPNAPDPWQPFAENPAYIAFARRALEAAADRAEAIHAGEIPYRGMIDFLADRRQPLRGGRRLVGQERTPTASAERPDSRTRVTTWAPEEPRVSRIARSPPAAEAS